MTKKIETLKATKAILKEGKSGLEVHFYFGSTHIFTMYSAMPNFKAGETLTLSGIRMEIDGEFGHV